MDAAAPGTLVDEAQRQLRELHGPDARIPEPTSAYFQDWVQDPYGAAYHFWQVGAKSWEIMPRMRHPVPGANLYVCGDGWSTGQGWVYGALTQAELMLEEHFGLPRPTWLSPDVYLGW
ncbi:FAD-dependent oxidoreductase [Streptomyces sp. JH14]|uniref:FAD-dependent oxidoreductase n=1 Tax=Streptomyces sp. JH14 TaxID=2793630 RepID=UPI0023FA1741|nr:FAD-dependent oxidoreductase [Streptomyces sp. JH14]MDF6043450.1 FAD-dependent oxidoreductase [Streptomyces sp. JH14]